MKSKFIVLSLILVLTLQSNSVKANDTLIPFTNMENKVVSISDYNGKYVFVEAFATWCESCELEMAHLKELYSIVNTNISMLSISIDPDFDNIEKVNNYIDRHNADWDFGIDHDLVFNDIFKVGTLPTAFLFDQDGNKILSWIGIISTSNFINDINYAVEEFNYYYESSEFEESKIVLNEIVSNPLFLITFGIIVLNSVYMLKVRITKKPSKESNTLSK